MTKDGRNTALLFVLGLTLFVSVSLFVISLQQPKLQPVSNSSNLLPPPPAPTALATVLAPEPAPQPEKPKGFQYIEVLDGCGPYWQDNCLNVRSGPGMEFDIVTKLRTGIVLKVAETVQKDGRTWYKIDFDEWIRYPERVTGDWYVAGDYVRFFEDEGVITYKPGASPPTKKRIEVDQSEQKLYAFDGDVLVMEQLISTGLYDTPTPLGEFIVYVKTPTRYMQGPLPGISDDYYDLPGVPWNLFFSKEGAVVHGAYWHDKFGQNWSHGCVNLTPQGAKELYAWADIGMKVIVRP